MNRLKKLRQSLTEHGLDALLVFQPQNRRYLSGFCGSTGWLLISQNSASLAVDFRYVEQAKSEAPGFEIVHIKGEPMDWLPDLAANIGIKKLGFESGYIPHDTYRKIYTALRKHNIQFLPTEDLVESLRAVKDEDEVKHISEAVKLADSAFDYAKSIIRPGMKEKEVAWDVEKFLRSHDSEALPFDIIIASGPNSALPHARASDRAIRENEPIVIDLGARINGYCSDLTRTIVLGNGEGTLSKIYDIVLGAQLTALATITTGMTGDEADRLARTVIKEAGYGDNFGHGLGHGVGLSPHELPRLTLNSSDKLKDGMVFTIEPGIYIPGWGGVRIEDMVILENGKARPMSRSDKIANATSGGLLIR
jgi:Xaa-Pro aminopeptidase